MLDLSRTGEALSSINLVQSTVMMFPPSFQLQACPHAVRTDLHIFISLAFHAIQYALKSCAWVKWDWSWNLVSSKTNQASSWHADWSGHPDFYLSICVMCMERCCIFSIVGMCWFDSAHNLEGIRRACSWESTCYHNHQHGSISHVREGKLAMLLRDSMCLLDLPDVYVFRIKDVIS